MRYLRHGPLAFWLVCSLLVGGVVLYARQSTAPAAVVVSPSQPQLVMAWRQSVMDATVRIQNGVATAEWLDAWSAQTADMAETNAVTAPDGLADAWREAAAAARSVGAVAPDDQAALVQAVSRSSSAADHLAGLAMGIPVAPPVR